MKYEVTDYSIHRDWQTEVRPDGDRPLKVSVTLVKANDYGRMRIDLSSHRLEKLLDYIDALAMEELREGLFRNNDALVDGLDVLSEDEKELAELRAFKAEHDKSTESPSAE